MTDEPKLLPCPFCGNQHPDPHGWASKNPSGPVVCDGCGAAVPVEAWNTRTDHAHALVAEAYEVAAKGTEAKVGPHVHPQSLTAAVLLDLAKSIRTLTPADAIAARDADRKQVREQALREAMQIYRKNACDEQRSEIEILALIEKGQDQ